MKSLRSKNLTQSGQRQSLFRSLHNIFNSTVFIEVKFFFHFYLSGPTKSLPFFYGVNYIMKISSMVIERKID